MVTKKDNKTKKSTRKPVRQGRDASGKFVKGRKKTGGRAPGTKNKYSSIRDALKEEMRPYLEQLGVILAGIRDPKDLVDAMSKIMPFFLPRYSSTTISADHQRPIGEEERLKALDDEYKKKDTAIEMKKLTIIDNDKEKETAVEKSTKNPLK